MKNFTASLSAGTVGEARLDQYFKQLWAICPATPQQQRQGIDRVFYDLATSRLAFTVEYKFDERAHQTGNAFVELISSDATGQLGWAFTCQADRLFYCVAGDLLVYILEPAHVRSCITRWVGRYGQGLRAVSSRGTRENYNTIGLLVPLRELEAIALQTVSM